MKWLSSGFLVGVLLGSAGSAHAAWTGPKVVTHISAPTSKNSTTCTSWSPTGKWIPCSQYTVGGPTGQDLLVYLVVGQFIAPQGFGIGLGGVSIGIDYDGDPGQGVDVYGWTLCSDGLEFPNEGPRGLWPASGGGNVVTWVNCPETYIGLDGIHGVLGALSVYAYSPDRLKVTPNRNLEGGPVFSVANCIGVESHPDTVSTLGWAGFNMPGHNPCEGTDVICPPEATDFLDIDLNIGVLDPHGNYIKAHIELWHGFGLPGATPPSAIMNGAVDNSPALSETGDWNQNGIPDFTVFFPRTNVESILQDGDQVRVRITGTYFNCAYSGSQDIRFIRPHLRSPNGGEFLLAGGQAQVNWDNPTGWPVGYSQIQYSADGGNTWSLVADHVSGNSYAWTVPQSPTRRGLLRVVILDNAGVMGYDASDGLFTVLSASGVGDAFPTAYRLHSASPNPFRAATWITFDLPEPGGVTIKIVDLAGRVVRLVTDDAFPAGTHTVTWNARDDSGNPVSGGIYFVHLQAGSFSGTQRLYLQK